MKKFMLLLVVLVTGISFVNAQKCSATFVFQGNGNSCGLGTFKVYDTFGAIVLNTDKATSGNTWAANNSEFTTWKNIGAIPPGTYRITIENSNKNIFRLHPISTVDKSSYRSGFLIHGFNTGQSRDEASKGCIILDANERAKLRTAIDGCGAELNLTAESIEIVEKTIDISGVWKDESYGGKMKVEKMSNGIKVTSFQNNHVWLCKQLLANKYCDNNNEICIVVENTDKFIMSTDAVGELTYLRLK
ncbi:MAG: DUF2778 domain-containing protein [Bacteroidales bacterium]|nr:DUF2778 domain-containing protein [Bacteroidales bacterium]